MTLPKRYYWLGHQTPSSQDTFFIEALDPDLWQQGDEDNWDTCWYTGMPDPHVFDSLSPHQTVNHIPGNNSLTIKSNLNQTLVNAKQRLLGQVEADRYGFFPKTYSMPEDYFDFQTDAQAHPEQLWIQKPKNLSRGRGIDMVKHPSTVPLNSEWIIQRYLSNPHLMNDHKYVLRCYVLITSVEPLRVYWYQEGFAKLASERYSEDDLDNLYRHLTNPDINEENTTAEVPVTFISFKQYRQWLRDQQLDDEQLFDDLKDLITLTAIAARETMRKRTKDSDGNTQGCYELIGLDCMVDNDLKPWILECNLSPSLDTYSSGDEEANDEVFIKRHLVKDTVNILGLNNEKITAELPIKDQLEFEMKHAGQFECLFPNTNANQYVNCFPIPRYKDILSLPTQVSTIELPLGTNGDNEFLFEDSLAIFSQKNNEDQGDFIIPNDIAAWIWLKNNEGLTPEKIAAELEIAMPKPESISEDEYHNSVLTQVWDVLADWSQAGLFRQHTSSSEKPKTAHWAQETTVSILGQNITLRIGCAVARKHLEPLLADRKGAPPEGNKTIDIIKSHYGYSLISGAQHIDSGVKLSELLPCIYQFIFDSHASQNSVFLQASAIRIQERTFLFSGNDKHLDSIAHYLSNTYDDINIISGMLILDTNNQTLITSDLPLRLPLSTVFNSQDTLVCAESNGLPYYLHPIKTNQQLLSNINNFIFINSNTKKEDPSGLHGLTKAEALVKLWNCVIDKKPALNKSLQHWIDNQNCLGLTINERDDLSEIADRLLKSSYLLGKDDVDAIAS